MWLRADATTFISRLHQLHKFVFVNYTGHDCEICEGKWRSHTPAVTSKVFGINSPFRKRSSLIAITFDLLLHS